MTKTSDTHPLMSATPRREGEEPLVLVVDDDSAVRMVVTRALEATGYTVLGADDGAEALEFLECEGAKVDLVLTDICMPRLGGLELGREIAARQWSVPVLYMSADPPDVIRNGDGLIQPSCLRKPFSIATLVATVGFLLTA